MKKIFFFAAAILATTLTSCFFVEDDDSCTCYSDEVEFSETYEEEYMWALGVDDCDEMAYYLTDLVDGYYIVDCY